jgi:hypothetical protein
MNCPICGEADVRFVHHGGDAYGRTAPSEEGTITLSCRCSMLMATWMEAGGEEPPCPRCSAPTQGTHLTPPDEGYVVGCTKCRWPQALTFADVRVKGTPIGKVTSFTPTDRRVEPIRQLNLDLGAILPGKYKGSLTITIQNPDAAPIRDAKETP